MVSTRRFVMKEVQGHTVISSISNKLVSIKRLAETKKIALRRRIWFKSLSRIERGIIDLTIKYIDNVKSTKLAKVLTVIINKLQTTMKSRLDHLVGTIGFKIATKISEIASSWGNKNAYLWGKDPAFARFLVINYRKTGAG